MEAQEFSVAFSAGKSRTFILILGREQIPQVLREFLQALRIGTVVEAPDSRLPVDQHKSRAVLEASVDIAEHEYVAAEMMQVFLGASQEVPFVRIRAETLAVRRERLRRVPCRIDRERDHPKLRVVLHFVAELAKLRSHARTGTRTCGVDEVRDPDLPVQTLLAVERAAALIGKDKIGNDTVRGQGRTRAAGGQQAYQGDKAEALHRRGRSAIINAYSSGR